MYLTRGVSLTNFMVASSALAFQVFVLYPWHEQLDHDFAKLREEQVQAAREEEKARAVVLSEIRSRLEGLEKEKSKKWGF